MKVVNCPCGEVVEAETDDDLVEKVQAHVADAHPEMADKYTRDQILSIAE
jgi:hypothetical protein